MSKIRILAIPPDVHGVGKFRILNPYTYIQENYPDDFHIDIKMNVEDNDDEFKDYDIIVLHTFIHNRLSPEKNLERIQWLKNNGKIVIADIDDYWEPDMRHPMYTQVKKQGLVKIKLDLLKNVQYVTVTTSIFADLIKQKLGLKNIFVFPNAIDETEPQFQPQPIKTDRIKLSWIGGSSHMYDVQLMEQGISAMYNTHKDKVQFVLCGFDLRGTYSEFDQMTKQVKTRDILPEETVWYRYEKIFTKDYKELDEEYTKYLKMFKEIPYDDSDKPYVRRWTKEITKYATHYNYSDISLAPLVSNTFNHMKSQLKAIEAGFHKKALIASETKPYTLDLISAINKGGEINPKGNCLLVSSSKDHKQWYQHMKKLVDNPNMVEDLGNKLYDTVKDKFSLKKVCEDRVQFLKSIININI